jgi:nitrogen regulatory protein PII
MKLICAIIKPFKLEEVKDALAEIGLIGLTVAEVKGFGRHRGHTEIYRGSEYTVDFLPKIMIHVMVEDSMVASAEYAIQRATVSGKIGDGHIWTIPLHSVLRIRTSERLTDQGDHQVDLESALPPTPSPKKRLAEPLPEIPPPEAEASPEHTVAKNRIHEMLNTAGFKVERSIRLEKSFVDFRLQRNGKTYIAIYRTQAKSEHAGYIANLPAPKDTERVIICDGIFHAVEVECAKQNVKVWSVDTLAVLKYDYAEKKQEEAAAALRVQSSPVQINITTGHNSPIGRDIAITQTTKEILTQVEQLQTLLEKVRQNGGDSDECANAAEAIRELSTSVTDAQDGAARKQGKRALNILKGTSDTLGKLNEVGEKFAVTVKLIAPLLETLFGFFR